jgi:putative chitinase
MITIEQLDKLVKNDKAVLFTPLLNEFMPKYGIDTLPRIRHFLAQGLHESQLLERLEENLNYSAPQLVKVFPKYFTPETALNYAFKPQAIANYVYANREGNGNQASGDGYKYRGRGMFQATLKNQYKALSLALNVDFVTNPHLLQEPRYAVQSACFFWFKNNLNRYADCLDGEKVNYRSFKGLSPIEAITRTVNGGLNGFEERKILYNQLKSIIK